MKKKIYLKPDVKVRQINAPQILAGSSEAKAASTEDLEDTTYNWAGGN